MTGVLVCVAAVAAVAVHEAGHYAAARAVGQLPRLRVRWCGPRVVAGCQPDWRIAAAGPAANLVLAAAAYVVGLDAVAVVSLVLLVELIPIPGSDGWQIVRDLARPRSTRRVLARWFADVERADRVHGRPVNLGFTARRTEDAS